MKIEKLHIYGFGPFVDYKINVTEDSLTCIYGENEAGKSSLYQFLLFMLFGMPPRERKRFMPRKGGTLGGMLQFVNEKNESIKVIRQDHVNNGAAVCYLETGEEKDETYLESELKQIDKHIFQSVFSFSSEDLHKIRQLKSEELSEVLFGMTLSAATNIYEVEKRLDKNLDELFKPQGVRPLINQKIQQLDEINDEIEDKVRSEHEYKEKNDQLFKALMKQEDLETILKKNKDEQLELEKRKQLSPLMAKYKQLQKKQKEKQASVHFPEEGIKRYEQLKEQTIPIKTEEELVRSQLNKERQAYSDLEAETLSVQEKKLLQELEAVLLKHENKEQERLGLLHEANRLESELKEQLDHIDMPVSTNLSDIHFPFHIKEDVKQYLAEVSENEQANTHTLREIHLNKERRISIVNELDHIEADLLDDAEYEALLTEEKVLLESHLQNELKVKQEAQMKKAQRTQQKRSKHLLQASAVLAVITVSFGFFFHLSMLYFLAVFLMSFGLATYMWNQAAAKQWHEVVIEGEEKTHKEAEQERLRLIQSLINEQVMNENRLHVLKGSLQEIDNEIKINMHMRKENLNTEEKLMEKKQEFEKTYPFLIGIDPTYWLEMIEHLQEALHILREKQVITEKVEAVSTEKNELQDQIEALNEKLDSLGKLSKLEGVRRILQLTEEKEKQLKDKKKTIEELKETIKICQTKLDKYETEVKELFDFARVEDEEAYYHAAKQWEESRADKEEIKRLIEQIARIDVDWKGKRDQVLDEFHLQRQIEERDEKIEEITAQLNEGRDVIARLRAEINYLEVNRPYDDVLYKNEVQQTQLKEEAIKWAVYKVAQTSLKQTMFRMQDSHLPGVIAKMKTYFAYVTENKYVDVIAPTEDLGFQVERADHLRFSVEELSKGTIDLLYICLRLAIAKQLNKQYRLPIFIDDSFVHFDDNRAKRMMDLLSEHFLNHQLLMFTCKQNVKELVDDRRIVLLRETI